ncbi:MAG: sarcosine oxidase subunit delta, partial [Pseudomonadota bacterium]
LTDEQWTDYLFNRKNPKGPHQEMWFHAAGCRQWFNAVRDTVSYEFQTVYKIGDPAPKIDGLPESSGDSQ